MYIGIIQISTIIYSTMLSRTIEKYIEEYIKEDNNKIFYLCTSKIRGNNNFKRYYC